MQFSCLRNNTVHCREWMLFSSSSSSSICASYRRDSVDAYKLIHSTQRRQVERELHAVERLKHILTLARLLPPTNSSHGRSPSNRRRRRSSSARRGSAARRVIIVAWRLGERPTTSSSSSSSSYHRQSRDCCIITTRTSGQLLGK